MPTGHKCVNVLEETDDKELNRKIHIQQVEIQDLNFRLIKLQTEVSLSLMHDGIRTPTQ